LAHNNKTILAAVGANQRLKKGKPLNVIPMGVANQHSTNNTAGIFLCKGNTQATNAGTSIDDNQLFIRGQYIDAGCISTQPDSIRAGGGYGSTNTPKPYTHPFSLIPNKLLEV
jgi:hypothetical protein